MFHAVPELRFLDGMHVAIRPSRITPEQMQRVVTREYRRFYSRIRIARAFLNGLLLRYRRLGEGQRIYLRSLRPWRRVREWAWMHLEFKFAPWEMLRVGRRRVVEFMHDPDYNDYLARLAG